MRSLISLFILLVSFVVFSLIMDHLAHAFNTNSAAFLFDEKSYVLKHDFTVTAYCPGKCCNGKWAGLTARGVSMDYYIKRDINIVAVDPEVIPLNSIIVYDNKQYLAVDVGSKIRGRRIDILFKTHDETIEFGIKSKQTIQVIKK